MSILLSKISNSWNNIIGKKELDNSQTLRGKEVAGDGAPVDEKQETQILKEKYDNILEVLENNINIKTKNKITCSVDIRELVELDLEIYMYQRQKNEEHIKKLEEGIKKTGYLYHNLILVDIPSKYTISIVDGQHRYEALKSIIKNEYNITTICVDVIKIDDENHLIELYESINHYLPHDMEKIREDRRYIEFVKMIKEKFGDKSITDNQVNRKHYLREKLLKEKIQEEKLLSKYTEEELCERIIAYNKKKGKEILKDKKKYSSSLKDIERCKERNFWLGFKPIDDWIKNL